MGAESDGRGEGNLGRRAFLGQMVGTAIGAQALSAAPWIARSSWAEGSDVIVETTSGKIRGRLQDGVRVFKGIPYGASTAGPNRFKAPRPPEAWSGVRDALAYGAAAPQSGGMGEASSNEDCLVLNVWTPALRDGTKRPVMVWLHGGGFSAGSGSSAVYDGTNLCHSGDVVLVTLNHRLNILGSCYLGELAGEGFADSGCAGMLDIIAALRWVRDNIENFGGDPKTVTLFGESGGGRKTSLLLAMPDAKGLFHRAIIESGAILEVVPKQQGTRAAEMFLRELGLDASRVNELATLPVEQLLRADSAVGRASRSTEREVGLAPGTPVLDGAHIPRHPFAPDAPAISAEIPVIVGYNRTEETIYYRRAPMTLDLDEKDLASRVAKRLGDRVPADQVIAAYRRAHPGARPWDLWMLICTDHPRGTYPQTLAVRRERLQAAPTYVYRFDFDLGNEMRTPHSLEIAFVFDNLKRPFALLDLPQTPAAFALAKQMSATWINFARTGKPDTSAMPHWPAYTAQSRHTMLFNAESRVEEDPSSETRKIMEKVIGLV